MSALPEHKSGIRTVLQYTGIPPSWLDKRPKLPSRNWLIFLSVTSSVVGYYAYDRRQCKKIRDDYITRVKHYADEPLPSMALPRKVRVYGCKWPGDEDYDQSMKYFRKYVKPIFVSAAIDYEMVNGRRHGDLANRIADEIKAQRRIAAGIDVPPESLMPTLPSNSSPEVKRQRELDGGIVIVGRPAFKEYLAGLRRGWSEPLDKVDREETLAVSLSDDGRFDEVDDPNTSELGGEPIPTPSRLAAYSPLRRPEPPRAAPPSAIPASLNEPPSSIPQQPPLLLVSFTDLIGFTQIPLMLWDFFNQRHKVRSGAEAAYRLVEKSTRPIDASTDLDFSVESEAYYKSSLASTAEDIESARTKYYDALPAKLETARALARRTREPTKDEESHPPPTEVELRAERLKKELRWRGDLEGWSIVKPDAPVSWDERFRDSLRVFVDPPSQSSDGWKKDAEP
ncbi:hypothetical protein PLICRDRAFT_110774 [Plicaturopsis crispa FD-325 SS-3]|nr:hypothetical protein PLICRDRAFT_110774 [Plicaturopsis crispa FD-325 SS-3]